MVKKICLWILGAGCLVALLKVFNGDPFGIVNWICASLQNIVVSIGDYLSNNSTFRHIFSKPIPKKS